VSVVVAAVAIGCCCCLLLSVVIAAAVGCCCLLLPFLVGSCCYCSFCLPGMLLNSIFAPLCSVPCCQSSCLLPLSCLGFGAFGLQGDGDVARENTTVA